MTLEELWLIYNHARINGEDGVRAVVVALRDELKDMPSLQRYMFFEDILGSDAGEKATIKETAVGAVLRLEAGDPPLPATDAAPAERSDATAVCVWKCVVEGAEYDIYDVSCNNERLSEWRRPKHCPFCGKPIKFTEAK